MLERHEQTVVKALGATFLSAALIVFCRKLKIDPPSEKELNDVRDEITQHALGDGK